MSLSLQAICTVIRLFSVYSFLFFYSFLKVRVLLYISGWLSKLQLPECWDYTRMSLYPTSSLLVFNLFVSLYFNISYWHHRVVLFDSQALIRYLGSPRTLSQATFFLGGGFANQSIIPHNELVLPSSLSHLVEHSRVYLYFPKTLLQTSWVYKLMPTQQAVSDCLWMITQGQLRSTQGYTGKSWEGKNEKTISSGDFTDRKRSCVFYFKEVFQIREKVRPDM